MIVVLGEKYVSYGDEVLDQISRLNSIDNVEWLAQRMSMSKSMIERRLKSAKDRGDLVSCRYKDNNVIWMIGDDAKAKYNGWEAYQIAKYRLFVDMGGDTRELDSATDDERENMLIDIPVFYSEREDAMSDAGYGYMHKINKIMNAKGIEATQELKDYVDTLWSKL